MGVEISLYQTRFKNFKRKYERESPKRTISASGGFGHYKWFESPTPGHMQVRRLFPEG